MTRQETVAAELKAAGASLVLALPQSLHAERNILTERIEALIAQAAPASLQQRAWLASSMHWGNTQKHRSYAAAKRALDLARTTQPPARDSFDLYFALARTASAAALVGEMGAATAALVEMRLVEDPGWPAQRLLWGISAEALAAGLRGDPAEALRRTRQQLAADRARGASSSSALTNLINFELAAGDAAGAARSGAALVATLERSRNELHLAYARLNLTAALLMLDDQAQARAVAQAGWPQAARFELQACWGDYLGLLAALDSRPQAAAQLLGYADASYPVGEVREPNEASAYHRARALARTALGFDDYERLHAQGAKASDADIPALAFVTQDI